MAWIWTLHRAHNKSKSPIEEDNIWATPNPWVVPILYTVVEETKRSQRESSVTIQVGPANLTLAIRVTVELFCVLVREQVTLGFYYSN